MSTVSATTLLPHLRDWLPSLSSHNLSYHNLSCHNLCWKQMGPPIATIGIAILVLGGYEKCRDRMRRWTENQCSDLSSEIRRFVDVALPLCLLSPLLVVGVKVYAVVACILGVRILMFGSPLLQGCPKIPLFSARVPEDWHAHFLEIIGKMSPAQCLDLMPFFTQSKVLTVEKKFDILRAVPWEEREDLIYACAEIKSTHASATIDGSHLAEGFKQEYRDIVQKMFSPEIKQYPEMMKSWEYAQCFLSLQADLSQSSLEEVFSQIKETIEDRDVLAEVSKDHMLLPMRTLKTLMDLRRGELFDTILEERRALVLKEMRTLVKGEIIRCKEFVEKIETQALKEEMTQVYEQAYAEVCAKIIAYQGEKEGCFSHLIENYPEVEEAHICQLIVKAMCKNECWRVKEDDLWAIVRMEGVEGDLEMEKALFERMPITYSGGRNPSLEVKIESFTRYLKTQFDGFFSKNHSGKSEIKELHASKQFLGVKEMLRSYNPTQSKSGERSLSAEKIIFSTHPQKQGQVQKIESEQLCAWEESIEEVWTALMTVYAQTGVSIEDVFEDVFKERSVSVALKARAQLIELMFGKESRNKKELGEDFFKRASDIIGEIEDQSKRDQMWDMFAARYMRSNRNPPLQREYIEQAINQISPQSLLSGKCRLDWIKQCVGGYVSKDDKEQCIDGMECECDEMYAELIKSHLDYMLNDKYLLPTDFKKVEDIIKKIRPESKWYGKSLVSFLTTKKKLVSKSGDEDATYQLIFQVEDPSLQVRALALALYGCSMGRANEKSSTYLLWDWPPKNLFEEKRSI